MTFITGNDANGTLSAGITAVAVSLTLTAGQGARFPAVAAPDIMTCLLTDNAGSFEYVDVTAHAAGNDTFTIVRAVDTYREGAATALAWSIGAKFMTVVGKKMVENKEPLWLPNIVATPVKKAGGIQVLSQNLGGRSMPKWVSPTGVDFWIQSALWESNITLWKPGAAAAFGFIGDTPTVTGTITRAAPAAGSFGAEMNRQIITSAATANTSVGLLGAAAVFARIVAAGHGGLFFFVRFRLETVGLNTSYRLFLGLSSIAALPTTVEPSALAASQVGFGFDAGDTTLQFMSKDGTTARKVSVGAGATKVAGNTYDGIIFISPGDGAAAGVVCWALYDTNTGSLVGSDVVGSATNAPLANTMMRPIAFVGTLTAVAQAVSISNFYAISDY